MTIKPNHHLQVGEWQYLPEQDKLVQFDADGKVSATADLDNLSQKVANYFIVNAGRLVTKDELLLDVWGIRDVSDGRVTRVIRVLRVALGDDTREPKYIETIPKRGYRFIAAVKELELLNENDSEESQDNTATRSQIWFGKKLILSIALLVLSISVSTWLYFPTGAPESANQTIPLLRYTPVTSLDGLEFYHNVSEDGRYLLYSYASPGDESVTVLMLEDMMEHKRIQLTERSFSSFGAAFSPDGSQIAYHRYYASGRCSIRLAEFDKKAFAIVSDTELTPCTDSSPSSRLTWSPDAKYVIYPTMSASRQMVLMMQPTRGGAAEQLTTPPPSSFGDYAARFSFSGDKIVFLRGAGNYAQLWLLNLVSRELKLLVSLTGTLPGNVGWSADDQFVIYPSAPTILSKVNIETGASFVIAYTDLNADEIMTTKSGHFYATVGSFAHTNVKEVSNPLATSEKVSKVVFSSNRNENHAEANPVEGGPTAVVSKRSGLSQIWLFYPDGEQRQLTFFEKNERIRNVVFSPNGKRLILQLHNQLWLLSDTGELTRVPHNDDLIISDPTWGKTGKYIYFSESINGRWQIARFDVETMKIDPEPYAFDQEFYLESYDGKYSFWRDAISKKFYIKWLDTGLIDEIPVSFPDMQLFHKFQAKSSGVYFAYLLDNIYYTLKCYDFKSKKIVDVLGDQVLTHSRFSISSDEKRLFILESVRGDLDIATLELL
jgi:transcriptional activator of cad operon